jgi:hypothetical protein
VFTSPAAWGYSSETRSRVVDAASDLFSRFEFIYGHFSCGPFVVSFAVSAIDAFTCIFRKRASKVNKDGAEKSEGGLAAGGRIRSKKGKHGDSKPLKTAQPEERSQRRAVLRCFRWNGLPFSPQGERE